MVLCSVKYFDRVNKPISSLYVPKYFSLAFLFSFLLSGNLLSSNDHGVSVQFSNSASGKEFYATILPGDTIKQQRKRRSPEDSLKRVINREARRASFMSMALPGLGQAYNRQFWKIPVIYAALGGLGYFFLDQNKKYQAYHKELKFRYDNGGTLKNDSSLTIYTLDQLNTQKILYKKHRDFLMIGMGMVYLLNIIDANVGAHLKTFDVSDKLSLGIRPKAFYCSNSPYGVAGGISIALNFK